MRLGLFADPHYCPADLLCRTRRPRLSLGKIRDAMEAFVSEGAELCICMGDLVDHCDSVQESAQCLDGVVRLIRSYPIPFRLLPGNHDYGVFSAGEFFARTGCPMPPYTTDTASHRLIFLDANFRSDFRRFDVAGVDWKDSNLPPAQLDFLARALEDADRPCVVLIHENLDPDVQPDHIVRNAALARRIIEDSGKVPLVLQGHYHPGADHVHNGIRYLTLPAMCEGTENHYRILDI